MAKRSSKSKADASPSERGYPSARSKPDHRDTDGTFEVGNGGGRGGRRDGAGRKPNEAKETFERALDELDPLCFARLREILSGEVKPNTLPDGTPVEGEFVLVVDDRVVLEAVKHVQNHKYGKPTTRIQIDGGDDPSLDTISRAKAARVSALGKQHQKAAKATTPPSNRNSKK